MHEELKNADSSKLPIGKLINIISKSQTFYLNHKLCEFGINYTQFSLLFEISHQIHINQERIANRCNINKGAVARSIKKLEEKELVVREIDAENRRQNKVSITKKGEIILNNCINYFNEWEDEIFNDETINREELQETLKKIMIKIMEINEREILNECRKK